MPCAVSDVINSRNAIGEVSLAMCNVLGMPAQINRCLLPKKNKINLIKVGFLYADIGNLSIFSIASEKGRPKYELLNSN